ncbi:hypothetical protein TNCV_1380561 [Trichonephila clavipes]|nr:hypothetical protein TNCV_1380561 [Trichonephila clavipes]
MRVWKQLIDEHRTTRKTGCGRRQTVRDFCSKQHMQLLPWPANSPDMSPIEHVWDLVGRRLARDPRPLV